MTFELCDMPGHEWMADAEDHDELDSATHRVRLLAPQEAIDANGQDQFCCAGCAIKLAEANIGFGWDVEVRRRDRPANVDADLDDLKLISEALDSHLYWQVNEDHARRNNGYVMEPYTEEEQVVVDLGARIDRQIRARSATVSDHEETT